MQVNDKGKIVAAIAALFIMIYAAVQMVYMPLSIRIQQAETEKREAEALKSDISPVLEQKQKLQKEEKQLSDKVADITETSGGKTATKEEFLLFLGETAKKNNVGVIGFKDCGMTKLGGIYTQTFDFQLKGDRNSINNILAQINDMGIKTSYVSVSFRQNLELDYLKRYFDELSDFPWFKEQDEAENEDEDEDEDEGETVREAYLNAGVTDVSEQFTLPREIEPQVPYTEDEPEDAANEGIGSMITQTVYKNPQKGIQTGLVYVSKKSKTSEQDSRMRLAVTVKLIMFNQPQSSTSFLRKEQEQDAVL